MVHIFYHIRDLDGLCSGAIARYYHQGVHKRKVKMHPFDYGWKIDELEFKAEDQIIFVDVTPPVDQIDRMAKEYNLLVIDHHASFINFIEENNIHVLGVQQVGKAGCELAWEFYFGVNSPEFVTLLGRYDVWDNSNKEKWETEILPFQYGARIYDLDPGTSSGYKTIGHWVAYYLQTRAEEVSKDTVIQQGNVILSYQKSQDKKTVELFAFDAEFEGYKAVVLNSARMTSNAFESVWSEDKYDIMVNFEYNGKKRFYTFSVYTTKEGIDCSKIAKKYGGGGHLQAAGFQTKGFTIINDKLIVDGTTST